MLFAFAAAVAAATSTTSSSGHHHHGHIGHRQDHQYIYAFGNHHPHAANRPAPPLLPFCVDGEPAHVTLSEAACAKVQGAATWLCNGLLRLQRASCAELGSVDFMKSVVMQIGLKPDGRAERLYGNASASMVQVHGKSARGKVGLWQSPVQIAEALIHIGSRVEVSRYIEVGVYTAWTCCFVSAFLRRVGPLNAFRGVAVDITQVAIAAGTKMLLPLLNVTFQYRAHVVLPPNEGPYDFCFIDGDHGYLGVRRDYGSFSSSCRSMMFHDVQDVSTLHLGNYSGGVPMFWAHLVANTHPHRVAEFTYQPPEAPMPSFGLGVLGPSRKTSLCEPDLPVDEWGGGAGAWGMGDGNVRTTWGELCRLNRTRLCSLGWRAIGEANSKAKHASSSAPAAAMITTSTSNASSAR